MFSIALSLMHGVAGVTGVPEGRELVVVFRGTVLKEEWVIDADVYDDLDRDLAKIERILGHEGSGPEQERWDDLQEREDNDRSPAPTQASSVSTMATRRSTRQVRVRYSMGGIQPHEWPVRVMDPDGGGWLMNVPSPGRGLFERDGQVGG